MLEALSFSCSAFQLRPAEPKASKTKTFLSDKVRLLLGGGPYLRAAGRHGLAPKLRGQIDETPSR